MSYTWTPNDYATLVQLSEAQNPPIDPSAPALLFYEESGMDPSNPGPVSANPPVGGLNQMNVPNLQALGFSRSQWLSMSASEQMPIIFNWWAGLAKNDNRGQFPSDAGMLLAMNFLPGRFRDVVAGSNVDAPLAAAAGPYASIYNDQHALLDPNSTGAITVNTCRTYLSNVANHAGARWQNIIAKIQAAGGTVNVAVAGPSIWATVLGGLVLGSAAYLAYEAYVLRLRPTRRRRFA
jgi:hypothetical protein